jgi:hypothetical protein
VGVGQLNALDGLDALNAMIFSLGLCSIALMEFNHINVIN